MPTYTADRLSLPKIWEQYKLASSVEKSTLDFSFGYWQLYAHPLRAQTVRRHFSELPSHPPGADEVWPLLNGGEDCICIPSHPTSRAIPALEAGPSLLRYVPQQYERYRVELSGTFEQYLHRMKPKRRSELRRKMRRFEQMGSEYFREYRSAEEMPVFLECALAVSRQSFQKRLGHGLPEGEEFIEQLVYEAAQEQIRGYVLRYGERPTAFALCRAHGDWLTGELLGYDSALSQLSPGTVLIGCILERLFEEQRFGHLDFGTGDAEYKASFATGSTRCADVLFLKRTFKNALLVRAHYLTALLWQWTKYLLEMLRMNRRLKKLARGGWKWNTQE